jgi:phenylacetate-coenzyme A ligase PaaK-like adenylate-forming protein
MIAGGWPALASLWGATVGFDVWAASVVAPEQLAQRQAARLAALLHAAAHTRRYAPLLAGGDPARVPLSALPPTGKQELMSRFDDGVADPALQLPELRAFLADRTALGQAFQGRYAVWESSGSTGEPGIFVQDARAMAVYDALEALRRRPLRPLARLADPWFLSERIAFVGAVDGHFASTVSMRRLMRLQPALAARLHLVSFLQPLPAIAKALEAIRPSIVATYPSMALLLAEERLAGRLKADPAEVWTGGETLTPTVRGRIEKGVGCPVADSYGLSEFLALASECRCGTLHLNSDWAILEVLDDQGRPVAEGVPGERALLTNLANHVQPLIRFDIGDRITLMGPCACGSPLPALQVLGRCDDLLRLAGRRGGAAGLSPLALTTVLEDDAGLFDFQLRQQAPDHLVLTCSAAGPDAQAGLRRGRAALQAFLERQGLRGIHIDGHAGQVPQRGRSGKAQRVVVSAAQPRPSRQADPA